MKPYKLVLTITIILACFCHGTLTAQEYTLLVGTTNGEVTESVVVCELDEAKQTIRVLHKVQAGTSPGYITLSKGILYTVSTDKQTDNEHTLRAFRWNEDRLDMLNEVSSKGLNPCHLAVSSDGKSLLTANYSSGSIAQYGLEDDGSLGQPLFFEQFEGSSVNQRRQQGPHAHYINTTVDGNFVLTADLGTDKVMIHQVNEDGSMSVYNPQPFLKVPEGSGPRHLEFHPNNRWIYVLNELNSTMSIVNYQNGEFELVETLSTLSADFEGTSYAAAVRIHPNGRYLYSSNRGDDSISVFEINDQGKLKLVQTFGEGLGWVRDFNLSPSGNFVVAGNEKEGQVVLLKLDQQGRFKENVMSLDLPNPSCFVFYE